ncbi:MAG: YlxM family DNA-binding protein [Ignavibacteriales bacterium]
MERFVRMAVLADVYGPLLTDNQRKVVNLHYGEDLSLGEIAEQFGISRAAVHDTLKRAQASLEAYEETLGVVAADVERERLLREALASLDVASGGGADAARAVDSARSIIRRLLGEPGAD